MEVPMGPKVLALVNSCGGCSNRIIGSRPECKLTGQIITDSSVIDPLCPLADYPGKVIADMRTTIQVLREPNAYSLAGTIISYIASKLNQQHDDRGISISLKNGQEVRLSWPFVTEINVHSTEIKFNSGNRKYKISLSGQKPVLSEWNIFQGVELWSQLELP
jgi:hypothetical protein